ncbi:MAG: energy transducer TonB [Deltaproteobacteria bacterium]|nr:energy transducer TonB [Deltaproteobacteria bacterium]MBK8718021.1 energy transducer TonB [Deltaproteobacteria bacterium]
MFDTYMIAHAIDPGFRRRVTISLGAALVGSALAIASYLGVEKLGVARVGAPHVELDVLMATTVPAPSAAPPPAAPPAAAAPEEPAAADDPPPEDHRARVEEVPLESSRPRARGEAGTGVPTGSGIPGLHGLGVGPVRDGPPCPIPGTCVATPPPVRPPTPVAAASTKVPLSVVKSRLRFSPNPTQAELARTPAGIARRGGTSVVEFCIDPAGKVEQVRTRKSAGDREIDRLCREAVARWRFSPTQVQGHGVRTCSESSFEITFD